MNKNERKTVGQYAYEGLLKTPENQSPIELQREMQKEYMDNLLACIEKHKGYYPDDFFIVVITKNERLMRNVFRNYFFSRRSCPTPDYDQTVFQFHRKDQYIEYHWTIPSRDTCVYLKDNTLYVHHDEYHLLHFILQFSDGSLYTKAKKLNGELDEGE